MAEQGAARRRAGDRSRRLPRVRAAIVGVLVAALALATSQLAASLIAAQAAPVAAVAQRMINDSPEAVKSFAITTFGAHDKLALAVGIVAVLFGLAAGLGVVTERRRWVGYAALLLLGTIGCAGALTQPGATALWAVPSLAGAAVGWLGLWWLQPPSPRGSGAHPHPESAGSLDESAARSLGRRRFLQRAAVLSGVAVGATLASRPLGRRLLAGDLSRAQVHIPPAAATPPPVSGTVLDVRGLTPLITPNAKFYRVDTAFVLPQVSAQEWRLRIHGMVDREIEIDFHDLLSRPLIERDIALTCVSNRVGGHLAGNARWVGVPLKPLLQEAGVRTGAKQMIGRSPDGMTIGTPTAIALDGRDSMLAVQMNGQPLPVEHGFPVRMIVPGLYGYESATKWLVDLELTTEEVSAYWVQRGWWKSVPIKTESRIDTPASGDHLAAGRIPVAGVAWAQHRGIDRVEVRVNGERWQDAALGPDPGIDGWRQWVWYWPATPGAYTIEARATDGTGATQTASSRQPFPSGATGWPRLSVTVS